MAGYTGASAGIPDITYVDNSRQPDTSNYLANTYFRFEFTRLPTVTYFCQRVNLPALTFTRAELPTQTGLTVKVPGGKYEHEDLTVSFLVDENMLNWLEVYNWMRSIGVHDEIKETIPYEDRFSDARIVITNSAFKPNLIVKIRGAFPTSLSGIDFDSTAVETEGVIATATFAFTNYEIETL